MLCGHECSSLCTRPALQIIAQIRKMHVHVCICERAGSIRRAVFPSLGAVPFSGALSVSLDITGNVFLDGLKGAAAPDGGG